MKKRLTPRELFLLGVLAAVALVSGYVMLWYRPQAQELERLGARTSVCREELDAAQVKLEEKRRMERELEEIFAAGSDPVGLAPYDNLQPVMLELHSILSGALNYSLSFGTVDGSQKIVRRDISLYFTCGSYDEAKAVLQKLHDSAYRCMLDSVKLSVGERGDTVAANVTIAFFEYQ